MGLGYIFPLSNFSVYLTSYIHEKQKFVTMHYGLFLNLIFSFAMTIGRPIGGFLELKLGFFLTSLTGLLIILVANLFFLNVQNTIILNKYLALLCINIYYSNWNRNSSFISRKKYCLI